MAKGFIHVTRVDLRFRARLCYKDVHWDDDWVAVAYGEDEAEARKNLRASLEEVKARRVLDIAVIDEAMAGMEGQ